jgi:hypothetical protein
MDTLPALPELDLIIDEHCKVMNNEHKIITDANIDEEAVGSTSITLQRFVGTISTGTEELNGHV